MDYKWIGAALILVGCGGFGFSLCIQHRIQETSLRQLICVLDYMSCELQYHMTPLPELCSAAATETSGDLARVFHALAANLEAITTADVSSAMEDALLRFPNLPPKTLDNLRLLGRSMGRFDLNGQLAGLEALRSSCRSALEQFTTQRDTRLRNYQTLGLCAGAALAILLI